MKFIYTRPEDNGVSVVIAAPKESVEHVLGSLTEKEYESHLIAVSIPKDAINPRQLSDNDLPESREFRDAWCDVTSDNAVDINLVKAKEIKLIELRAQRNRMLELLDKEMIIALGKNQDIKSIEDKKQLLRDCTEPLKSLEVTGYNDQAVLDQIRSLAVLPELG